MSFIRRFTSDPGADVLSQIEGVNIIDLPQPTPINGVATGVAALVAEFVDMTYAVNVAVNGAGTAVSITTKPQPTEVFSAQDLLNKVGGFDETIGEFGGDCGNGFVELRSKKFSRLILVPVNLASAKGARFWRELPTCKSATDPSPVVPMQPATVPAGREFRKAATATARLRNAAKLAFLGTTDYLRGVDGVVTNAAVAATNPFGSPGSDFIAAGTKKGDIMAMGALSGAGAIGANALTLRVVSVTDATHLVLERLDGATFTFTTSAAMPWRLHAGGCADTGPVNSFTDAGGYIIPVRPLTDNTGSTSGSTAWVASSLLTPVVAPPAQTSATPWDPLSGLNGAATPETAGIDYTAAIQKANAVNHSSLDALYGSALDSLLVQKAPATDVNIVWSARKPNSSVYGIHSKLVQHAIDASARGVGRTTIVSPSLDNQDLGVAVGTVEPGVGVAGLRSERTDYSWPGVLLLVPEAVNFNLACADGTLTSTGVLDQTWDGWLAVLLSNLAPERNPGQTADPVPSLLAPVLGLQRGAPDLDMYAYITMRQYGIAGPRLDQDTGIGLQSGITTSVKAGEKNINRRRMADYIEDSLARALKPYNKLPLTKTLKDGALGVCDSFLSGLLSANNPAQQRIDGYIVDGVSGNTPELTAAGIYVIVIKVRTTPTADFITLRCEVGESVDVTTSAT